MNLTKTIAELNAAMDPNCDSCAFTNILPYINELRKLAMRILTFNLGDGDTSMIDYTNASGKRFTGTITPDKPKSNVGEDT